MPTAPASGVSFTVKTNGQTLRVAAGTSASSLVQTLYSDAAITASVTTPHTITSDTTYYLPLDVANVSHYISVKQLDGTELWGKKQHLGDIIIEPVPSPLQVGADSSFTRNTVATAALYESHPRSTFTNIAAANTGTMLCVGIKIPAGANLTTASFQSGTTAGVALTNQWFALYSPSAALLGQTTNDTSTAWAANTLKTLTFTSPITTTVSGLHYLAIGVTAGTVPSYMGISGNALVNTIPPILSSVTDAALTDTAPATATFPGTVTAGIPYCFVS
jgi:hypothetical protein